MTIMGFNLIQPTRVASGYGSTTDRTTGISILCSHADCFRMAFSIGMVNLTFQSYAVTQTASTDCGHLGVH